jgi:hypothetical protein
MEELHNLTDDTLLSILSNYTLKCTRMIANGTMKSKEFYECYYALVRIQKEIEIRSHNPANNIFSESPPHTELTIVK